MSEITNSINDKLGTSGGGTVTDVTGQGIEKHVVGTGGMADLYRQILQEIGEDPEREGLIKTPERVAAAMKFFTQGYQQSLEEILNNAIFHEDNNQMVLLRDIEFYSLCEHHMVPFFGKCHVAYIPDGKIVGVSKIARIVDMFSRRLQVQERLTNQIASALECALSPRGVGVVAEGVHLCYDRETEILTSSGWVRFDQLERGVPVAQVDPATQEMNFALPTDYVNYRYRGPMIHWKSRSVDLLVTPDHRMIYRKEWDFVQRPSRGDWQVAPASQMPGIFYVPQSASWTVPDVENVRFAGEIISGDDYARFMGLWLAEGCTRRQRQDVIVSQNGGAFADELWQLLQLLPFNFRRNYQAKRGNHFHFRSSSRALYEELVWFGKSGDKRVPSTIKNLSARQIGIFLEWFAKGDGHFYKHNPLRVQYVSKSPGMIDDIQELLLRVGQCGAVQRYADHARIEVRTHKNATGKGYKWYGKLRPVNRRVVEFDDEVFCVSVPTGAVMVRRNGRPIVSGNCMVMRGVEKQHSKMTTSAMRGVFLETPTRMEMMNLIRGGSEVF